MAQIAAISFFTFPSLTQKVWAFSQMQFAHRLIAREKDLAFYKLMGSGKGDGFDPRPDWGVYSLLTRWNSVEQLAHFLHHSDVMSAYRAHSAECYTVAMEPITAHGTWAGKHPFGQQNRQVTDDAPICAITRATIKWKYLRKFWAYVPTSTRPLQKAPELLFSKGIGEVPIRQMATFSVWSSFEDMKAFAYQSEEHRQAIKMTRELGWYAEEMFARFTPIAVEGSYHGQDPLARLQLPPLS